MLSKAKSKLLLADIEVLAKNHAEASISVGQLATSLRGAGWGRGDVLRAVGIKAGVPDRASDGYQVPIAALAKPG